MEVTAANIEKDNTEESNADEIIKYQSLPIPKFSCTQWREYREKIERKERKNKKKSRAKTAVSAVPSSSRSKSHASIKSTMKGSLSTFLSKKLVSKVRDVVLVPKNLLKKGFINSDKPSIEDKLRDMYITDAIEEKSKVKDNKMEKDVKVNFVCNYLEKLVIAENLSYLYLKMYTDKFLVSIRKPNMDVSREKCIEYLKGEEAYEEFFNAVNNGEIPEDVFLNFENHCDILLYNIHAILKIEKFITVADGVENLLYSTFVHLKPNSSVIYAVLREIEEDIKRKNTLEENESNLHFDMSALLEEFKDDIITNQTIEGSLNKIDIESKFHFEMSGPLHLKIDEASTLDLMDFFLWKKTLLEHNTLSLNVVPPHPNQEFIKQDGQACCGTEIHIDPNVEVEFNQEWLQRTFEHISSSSQEADLDEFLYLDESPSFAMRNNKRNFMYLLSRRRIRKGHCIASNSRWNMQLVEIFFFTSKREVIKDTSEHSYEEVDVHYKLPVFTRSGLFYTYWSEETENKENIKQIKDFLPRDIVNMTCIGSREKLDKYIYNFVEMISERFRRYLMIEYNYEFAVNEKKMVTSSKCIYYTIEKYVIGDFYSMETDFVEDLNIESDFVLSSGSSDPDVEVVDEVPKEINIGDWQGCPCFSCSGDVTATDDIDAAFSATDDVATATDDVATATDDVATAIDDVITIIDDVITATDYVATATDNFISDVTATDYTDAVTAAYDFISAATSHDDFVGTSTSTCGFIGTSTGDFIDASTSTGDFIDASTSAGDFIDASTSAGDFIDASTSDDFMDIAADDATSTDITATVTDDISADFDATSTDVTATATDDIAADFDATSTDITATATDDIAADFDATSTDITITDDVAAAGGATSTDITATDDATTSTDAAGAISTDIAADDDATTSTDDAAATTSTDDTTAVTVTGDNTDDDDDNVAAVIASALDIHPDDDPDYDAYEDMPYFEIEFPDEEVDEYISSSPEGDMAVEENPLVLSSEQSMLSQVDEDMPLNDQDEDKAMLSDEEMSLSENILHDVEDVPHSENFFSSVSAISFDQPTSVIEDVSSNPDILIESDLYGNQMNWTIPENYIQPVEFDSMPILSGQPTQVSDTSPCSLGDSQPVSKDKYIPLAEDISDDSNEPESTIPSTQAASNNDILSEVFKQTNMIYPESYIQPVEFDSMPVLSGQPTQVSDTSPCSLGDSQPVSKDKYIPLAEDISDDSDEPESTIPSTQASSNKNILSEIFKQTNVIYPESFLSQGGYTPHYGIEDFPDLINQITGKISENFQYGHPFYGLHNEHASFDEEPVEHNVASGIQDLSFNDSLYGSQLNQKISENICNIKTVSSAEPAPGVDLSAEPAPGVDLSAEPAPGVDLSAEPAPGVDLSAEPAPGVDLSAEPVPGVDPSAEPTPGVDPSADDGSNNSLDEVNLYDHETSGEIPEKNPNLEFAGFREDPLNDDEIMPHEVPVESAPKSSGPFIYVSSTVKNGLVKTVFEAHEFELDNTPRIQLTKNDSKEEKVEAYPCLHKEFFYDPTDPNDIPDLHFDFKFEKKELDSLNKHLLFLSDVFKPRSVRKGSTMPGKESTK